MRRRWVLAARMPRRDVEDAVPYGGDRVSAEERTLREREGKDPSTRQGLAQDDMAGRLGANAPGEFLLGAGQRAGRQRASAPAGETGEADCRASVSTGLQ